MMTKTHIVKARTHHGSKSLDLTIPAEVRRKADICAGDAFIIESKLVGGELVLEYRRIFKSK